MSDHGLASWQDNMLDQLNKLRSDYNKLMSPGSIRKGLSGSERLSGSIDHGFLELQRLICNEKPPELKGENEQRCADVAGRVFGVAELLEKILLEELDVSDLLNAMCVNKTFRDPIPGSVKLLRRMSLVADRDCQARTIWVDSWRQHGPYLDGRTGLTGRIESTDPAGQGLGQVEDVLTIKVGRDYVLPSLGSRPRQMLICQPPLMRINIEVSCCQNRSILPENNGITIGTVLDVVHHLKETHKLCPFVSGDDMSLDADYDKDGFVKVKILLAGWVASRIVEPKQPGKSDQMTEEEAFGGDTEDPEVKSALDIAELGEYTSDKVKAHEAGRDIPTLAEWRASKTEEEREEMEARWASKAWLKGYSALRQ